MSHVKNTSTITHRDPEAAVAICEALGIRADRCSTLTITIDAPGTFRVEHTSWVDDPDTSAIAEQFTRMGPSMAGAQAERLGGA